MIFGGTGVNGTHQDGYRMTGITQPSIACVNEEHDAHWVVHPDYESVQKFPTNFKYRVQLDWGDGTKTPSSGFTAHDLSIGLTGEGSETHVYRLLGEKNWTHKLRYTVKNDDGSLKAYVAVFKGTTKVIDCAEAILKMRAAIRPLRLVTDDFVADPEGDGPCARYARRVVAIDIVPDPSEWITVFAQGTGGYMQWGTTEFQELGSFFVAPDPAQQTVTQHLEWWSCYDVHYREPTTDLWWNEMRLIVWPAMYTSKATYTPQPRKRAYLISDHGC